MTNFILRFKEQETRLTLQELDDDDDVSVLHTILLRGSERPGAERRDILLLAVCVCEVIFMRLA